MRTSPGKLRGLQASANAHGVFTILALDHGAAFLATVRPAAPDSVTFAEAVSIKTVLLRTLAPYTSAVLVDPRYGLWPAVNGGAVPGNVGLLVAVEDADYAAPHDRPGRLLEGWSVAKIKRLGAAAVKIFFYYHPAAGEATAAQEALVRQVVEDCRRYDLPLFAEPVSYGISPADRPGVVIESARRIGQLGVDVLKLEFPVDIRAEPNHTVWRSACRELSAACGDKPWVLLSAGVDFDTFAEQVRIACQAGASGYLAGRAIWQEAAQLTGEARQIYLQDTPVPRLQRLAEIATTQARPWTDLYDDAPDPVPPDWYTAYDDFS